MKFRHLGGDIACSSKCKMCMKCCQQISLFKQLGDNSLGGLSGQETLFLEQSVAAEFENTTEPSVDPSQDM